MRVEVNTIEDFCDELDADGKANRVVDSIVRVRMDRDPEQPEAVSFGVSFWATALIDAGTSAYILELGRFCGSDDAKTPTGGTDIANQWLIKLTTIAERNGLTIRRGKIEVI